MCVPVIVVRKTAAHEPSDEAHRNQEADQRDGCMDVVTGEHMRRPGANRSRFRAVRRSRERDLCLAGPFVRTEWKKRKVRGDALPDR